MPLRRQVPAQEQVQHPQVLLQELVQELAPVQVLEAMEVEVLIANRRLITKWM